jgi:hypothetical protein
MYKPPSNINVHPMAQIAPSTVQDLASSPLAYRRFSCLDSSRQRLVRMGWGPQLCILRAQVVSECFPTGPGKDFVQLQSLAL